VGGGGESLETNQKKKRKRKKMKKKKKKKKISVYRDSLKLLKPCGREFRSQHINPNRFRLAPIDRA
jgi:hypothetical protein